MSGLSGPRVLFEPRDPVVEEGLFRLGRERPSPQAPCGQGRAEQSSGLLSTAIRFFLNPCVIRKGGIRGSSCFQFKCSKKMDTHVLTTGDECLGKSYPWSGKETFFLKSMSARFDEHFEERFLEGRWMDTERAINVAVEKLRKLSNNSLDVLTVEMPKNIESAVNLSKIISKQSPVIGNLIEFGTIEYLNSFEEFKSMGVWKRQDPGFPDAIFESRYGTAAGLELKTWFPLATEITARFKNSQESFKKDDVYVALVAWLPEFILYGKPKVVGVCVVSGKSIAKSRDSHYHDPPRYLVIEPEDTSARTKNLQQSNTNGYKWQGEQSEEDLKRAERQVRSWGKGFARYSSSQEYQKKLTKLRSRFRYRVDTNFSKLDRIEHEDIEKFKAKVLSSSLHERSIGEWSRLISSGKKDRIHEAVNRILNLKTS